MIFLSQSTSTVLPHSRLLRVGEKTISGSYYVLTIFYLTTATAAAAGKRCRPLLGAFVKLSTGEQLNTDDRLFDASGDRGKKREIPRVTLLLL